LFFDRGFVCAKGDVFYVPFFDAKERNQRKAQKGVMGCFFGESEAFTEENNAPSPF